MNSTVQSYRFDSPKNRRLLAPSPRDDLQYQTTDLLSGSRTVLQYQCGLILLEYQDLNKEDRRNPFWNRTQIRNLLQLGEIEIFENCNMRYCVFSVSFILLFILSSFWAQTGIYGRFWIWAHPIYFLLIKLNPQFNISYNWNITSSHYRSNIELSPSKSEITSNPGFRLTFISRA